MADSVNEIQKILDIKVKYDDAINGITAYQKAVEGIKAREAELKKEVKDGQITREQYRKELEAGKLATTQYNDEIRTLRKEVQNNLKIEKEQEGSLKSLRAELSNATKAYDSLSRAERNGAKGKELKNHINEITTELKGAEEGTQRFYRNVGNYQNSILSALGMNNQFAQSLVNIGNSGGGVNAAFGAMSSGAKALGQTFMALMSNPIFLAVAGIAAAGMAFKWFYDYNQGIAEATRLTQEFSGLSGDELKGVRDEIQAMADTFGHDYKDVLSTVDALTAQYGMSWQEANQIVQDGFVSGADEGGKMLDLIKQYAPAFNDAGVSADEMVAIIQQTRSGIFSEDGLAMITKAGKSLRNMSDSTAAALQGIGINADEMKQKLADGSLSMMDAIQQVSAAMKDVSANSQEAGEVMDDVFGKKGTAAGQKQVQALADLNLSLEEVKQTTGEYGEMQEQAIETDKELNDVLASMFDMSDKGWETMIGNTKTMVKKWLVDFLKGVVKCINYLIDWYNNSLLLRYIVQALINSFKSMWEAIKFVFSAAVDVIKNFGEQLRGLGDIVEGVFTLDWSKIEGGFDRIIQGGKDMWTALAKDAKTMATNVANNTADAWNATMNDRIKPITLESFGGTSDYSGGGSGSGSGSGASSSGSGSGSGGSGKTTSGKNTGTGKNTPKKETEEEKAAKKAAQERADEEKKIQQQLDNELNKIAQEGAKKNKEILDKYYQDQIDALKAKQAAETDTTTQYYQNLGALIQLKEDEKTKALAAFDAARLKESIDAQTKLTAAQLAGLNEQQMWTKTGYQLKLQQLDLQYQTELAAVENNEALKLAIQQKYQKLQDDLNAEYRKKTEEEDQKLADEQVAQQQKKYETIGNLMSSFSSLAEMFQDKSKALAVAAKTLAIGEILLSQGVAVAKAVQTATRSSATWIDMLAAIATVVASVTAVMSTALSTTKSAKFAVGGYVSGRGTATSDSIPARLSNGESVMTAGATSLFSPILSAFNQLGGGVAITSASPQSQLGEDMIAAAVAKGMQMSPRPVVSVEEINRVNARVQVIERNSQI